MEADDITSEDCWTVISAFFREKGLVSQQLDSFDEFIHTSIQELVWEDSTLILEQPAQHITETDNINRKYEIKFGKIFLSRPTMTESDGTTTQMFPQEARLRNLTYAAPLFVEMDKITYECIDGENDWKVIKDEVDMDDDDEFGSSSKIDKKSVYR